MNNATQTNVAGLKQTALNHVSHIAALDEDGDGSPNATLDRVVRELATTLLAIRDTEWSRALLAKCPARAKVIAVGRELKNAR